MLIVQHMPPLFTRLLAERLSTLGPLQVEEATEGASVEPGKALIAPGDYHMRIKRQGEQVVATLDQGPPENSCRPAVDPLFRSVAEVYGHAALAVVLTGMGRDGLRGVEVMRQRGAFVIAQDQASSVVWGMPGYVVQAGLADKVASLGQVVPEILKNV
jgi:two-component system chemotaxis response regulator CheB